MRRRIELKRLSAGGVLALAAVVSLSAAVNAGASAQAAPGTPGTPQPGTIAFQEDFSSGTPAVPPSVGVQDYTGGPAANGATYSPDPSWRSTAQLCNGWILNVNTPVPATDTGCTTGGGRVETGTAPAHAWTFLQAMTYTLGAAQGLPPAGNDAVASQTNPPTGSGIGLTGPVQLASSLATSAVSGHFYQVSAWFAAVHCSADSFRPPTTTWYDPVEHLYLLEGTTATDPAPTRVELTPPTGLNPCTTPGAFTGTTPVTFSNTGGSPIAGVANFSVPIHIAHLDSEPTKLPAGVTNLGIQLDNSQTQTAGNDLAFDTPVITDVTPQLDKSFSPTAIDVGHTSTLTFTVTNTSELAAKNGWSFTDALPAGVVVANDSASSTCPAAAGLPSAAAATLTLSGDLTAGMASCTFTIPVTAVAPGTYTNGPGNVTTNGVLPPGSSTLAVSATPALAIAKAANRQSFGAAGQQVVYTYTVTNTGDVPASDVSVTDNPVAPATAPNVTCERLANPAGPCPAAPARPTLLPGQVAIFTASYTATSADVTAGRIADTGTVSGDAPHGTDPAATPITPVTSNRVTVALVAESTVPPTTPPSAPATQPSVTPSSPSAELAATGTSVPTLLGGGAALTVLTGIAVIAVSRRRRLHG